MEEKDRIIERINKLFALSESSNENEAASAINQAEKIMKQYSIEQIDLAVKTDITKKDYLKRKSMTWEKIVADSVARLFFCKVGRDILRKADKDSYKIRRIESSHFIGLKTNVQTCEEVYNRLIDWINIRAALKYSGKNKTYNRNKYKTGIAVGILNRVVAIEEERTLANETTALMCLNAEIEEYMQDYKNRRSPKINFTRDSSYGLRDSSKAPLFLNVEKEL